MIRKLTTKDTKWVLMSIGWNSFSLLSKKHLVGLRKSKPDGKYWKHNFFCEIPALQTCPQVFYMCDVGIYGILMDWQKREDQVRQGTWALAWWFYSISP